MRHTPRSANLYTLLATLVVIVFALCSPPMALAVKGCNEGSPADKPPQALWGELQPGNIIIDTTRYNGSPRADSLHPLYTSVDFESGFMFATYFGGLQVWDARGGNATQPVRLSQADGYSGAFPEWIPGNSEIDQYVYAVDAPEGNDNLAVVGALSPVGVSIWDTTDKSSLKALYQDTSKSVKQVYSAVINGRSYAFAASYLGNVGVHVYDMTAAKAFSRCVNNCGGVYLGTAGSTVSMYVHGMQFGNKHFIVRSAGSVKPWITEIWNVTNPASPSLVVTSNTTPTAPDPSGLRGVFTGGVAMWEHNGKAYMAARTVVRTDGRLKIYDVTSCLNGGCASLPAPIADREIAPNLASDFYLPVTFSRSGSTPFLFVGHFDACHEATVLESHTEYLFDVSTPSVPRDITPAKTMEDKGKIVDYWSWYYSDYTRGYSYTAPLAGKFNGPYFYRAAVSLLDIHEWTGGSATPPVANFTWSPSEVYPGDTVTFTDTSSGVVSSRSWSFQDGSPATGNASPQTVTFASPGTKTVQLQATRTDVGSDSETKGVTVLNPAPVVTSLTPAQGTTPQPTYYACQPVKFTATATGRPPLKYKWTLHNSNGPVPVNDPVDSSTFQWSGKINEAAAPDGEYFAKVMVEGIGSDEETSATIKIKPFDPLPTTPFTISNDDFQFGTVTFHAPTSGVTVWKWDFDDDGDGNPATPLNAGTVTLTDPVTGPNPTHTYTSKGPRKVRVTVGNCTAGEVTSAVLNIDITEIAPLRINMFQAQCNVAPCIFSVGESITFTQLVEGDPNLYKYDWDGNGSYEQTSPTEVKTHTYSAAGTYTPKMAIVRGTEPEVTFTHSQFTVSGAPPPPPPPPPGPSISISGSSSGQVDTAVTLTASASNCTAAANGWTWTTGGGTGASTTSSISITWSSSGSKTVTAKNSGCSSATGTKTIVISGPSTEPGPGGLTAVFTVSPASPAAGAAVTFDASASAGSPAIYNWDFGDGQTASGSTPTASHTYASAGNYTVKLEVGKAAAGCPFGFCSVTSSKPVVVTGQSAPVLLAAFTTNASCTSEFGFTQCSADSGQAVTFTSTSTGATSHSWKFGDGGAATGSQATHTWTQPGSYEVELTVGNGQATAKATRFFVVTGKPTASTKSVVLPWIAQTRGALNQSSDLYVFNPGATEMEVKLQFRKRGVPESTPPEITKKIAAGATLFVADALDDLFSRENVAGFITITVVKGDVEPVITSFNTTFQTDGSQFGQTVPGFSMSRTGSAAGSGAPSPVQHLVGLNDNGERLAYFGLSNPSDQPVGYRLRFFDKDGKPIGTSADTRLLSRFGQRQYQVNEIRDLFKVTDVDDYRIEIETVSGGGIVPYASNLRLASDDPSFVVGGAVQASKVYLIGALSQPGPNNSLWQSDVVLSNTATEVVLTDITFTPNGLNSVTTSAVKLTLQPGATERLVNVVADKWGIKDSAGVLVLDSDALKGIFPVVQGESYDNTKPEKRFGQTLPAFTDEDAAVPGKGHYLVGLRQDAKNRTTYWFYNPGTTTGEYDIIYRALDGTILGRIDGVRLGAGKARQVSPAQHPIPSAGVTGGFTVQFVVKAGKLLSAAQVVNNATNDPAYVKGELR